MTVQSAVIVHDFFVQDGGAERCAIELAGLLPDAIVHTTFFDERTFGDRLDPSRVRTWPLQRLLGGRRFRSLLPLYPLYFSTLNVRDASLVVSSSVAFAKGVRAAPGAIHVSYVYTPMRYGWDLDAYMRRSSYPLLARVAARALRAPLIAWDRRTAAGPDVIVAISATVRDRIKLRWKREAEIIYPPVDTNEFEVSTLDEGYLLVAARLLAYRRIDLAIAAANALGRQLVIAGDGPERRRLESLAGPTVRFMGHVERSDLIQLLARCHAYVVPGVEDFGIAAVEAMASGKPVVAFGRGGSTETISDGLTGVLFDEQSTGSLLGGLERLEGIDFDPARTRRHAEQFDRDVFIAQWRALLERLGHAAETR